MSISQKFSPLFKAAALSALALGIWIAVTTVRYVQRDHFPLPVWDHWATVDLAQVWASGQLTWAKLWAPHNEHRLLFPKLLFLADYRFANGSGSLLKGLILSLQAAHALLLIMAVKRWSRLDIWDRGLVAGLTVSLLFWLMQRDNFSFPFQVQFPLACLASSLSFLSIGQALRAGDRGWRWTLAAVAMAALAACSLSLGLFTLVVLLALIWGWSFPWRIRLLGSFMVLVAVALILIGNKNLGVNAGQTIFQSISHREYWEYLLYFLGCVIGPHSPKAGMLLGLLGFMAGLFVALQLLKKRSGHPLEALLFGWILLVLLVALSIPLRRVQFGLVSAASGRYVTIVVMLWITLGILALMKFRLAQAGNEPWADVASYLILPLAIILMLIIARGQLIKKQNAWDNWVNWDQSALAIITGVDDSMALGRLHPAESSEIFRMGNILKEHNWALYAYPWSHWLGKNLKDIAVLTAKSSWVGGFDAQAGSYVEGWTRDKSTGTTAELIVITDANGKVCGLAGGSRPRPDLSQGSEAELRCGWSGYVTGPQNWGILKAYALLPDGKTVSWFADNVKSLKLNPGWIGSRLEEHFSPADPSSCQGAFDQEEAYPMGRVRLGGWAWDVELNRQARFVLLCDKTDRIYAIAEGGGLREDLGKEFGWRHRWMGWETVVDGTHGIQNTRAYAVLGNGKKTLRLTQTAAP